MPNELSDHIKTLLPDLDAPLAQNCLPISDRIYLVTSFVLKTSSFHALDERGRVLAYSAISRSVHEWYAQKYGKHAVAYDCKLNGIARMRGMPVLLNIPPAIHQVVKEGEIARIIFADHLYDDEDIMGMIGVDINADQIEAEDKILFITECKSVVANLRTSFWACETMLGDEQCRQFAHSCLTNLDVASTLIVTQNAENLPTASWILHLAMECALKAYIRQHDSSKLKYDHKLSGLRTTAESLGAKISSDWSALPSEKKAISRRYNAPVTLFDVLNQYQISLGSVAEILRQLKRTRDLFNHWIEVQNPDLL